MAPRGTPRCAGTYITQRTVRLARSLLCANGDAPRRLVRRKHAGAGLLASSSRRSCCGRGTWGVRARARPRRRPGAGPAAPSKRPGRPAQVSALISRLLPRCVHVSCCGEPGPGGCFVLSPPDPNPEAPSEGLPPRSLAVRPWLQDSRVCVRGWGPHFRKAREEVLPAEGTARPKPGGNLAPDGAQGAGGRKHACASSAPSAGSWEP